MVFLNMTAVTRSTGRCKLSVRQISSAQGHDKKDTRQNLISANVYGHIEPILCTGKWPGLCLIHRHNYVVK